MTAYLSLGSNLGDRLEILQSCIERLKNSQGITLLDTSHFYETTPVGFANQSDFINAVVKIDFTMTPLELLKICQSVENDLGRVRDVRFGPRTCDVDILLIEGYISDSETLTVPHPRMWERAFVLVPLLDVIEKKRQDEIHKHLTVIGQKGVKKFKNK